MSRPVFAPSAEQQAVLAEMAACANERLRVEEQVHALIGRAKQLDIPIEHIAQAAKVTRKTVYRHLGIPMR